MKTRFSNLSKHWPPMALLVFLLAGSAREAWADFVLDWGVTSPTSWSDVTGPTFTQSFDIDSGYAGSEMTVTISDTSARMLAGYPAINSTLTGGTGSGNKSLQLDLNYSSTAQFITVTVSFDTTWAPLGVEDLAFTLFDVDRGVSLGVFGYAYVDEIRTIAALDMFGTTVAATAVIGSSGNTVSGSGLTYKVDGIASVTNGDYPQGNALISFSNSAIKQFSFVYGSGPSSFFNPAEQTIAIGDISGRKRIPEYHPALAAVLMCGLLAAWRLRLAGVGT